MAYSAVDERTKVRNGARCRTWRRGKNGKGYGIICIGNGKSTTAHRVAWQVVTGQVLPDALVPDHRCRNHACVEVRHLEPVTVAVNNARGDSPWGKNGRRTECPQGHPLSGRNLLVVRKRDGLIHRNCRACANASSRAWWQKKMEDPALREWNRKRCEAYNEKVAAKKSRASNNSTLREGTVAGARQGRIVPSLTLSKAVTS